MCRPKYEHKYDYSYKYIEEWNKTVLNIVIRYDDGSTAEFTDVAYGKLTDYQAADQIEHMYYTADQNNDAERYQ